MSFFNKLRQRFKNMRGKGTPVQGRMPKKMFGGGLLGKFFAKRGGFKNFFKNRAGGAPGGDPGLQGMPGPASGGGPSGMHKFLGRFNRGKFKGKFGKIFGRRGGGY